MAKNTWHKAGTWLGLLVSIGAVAWLLIRYDWSGVDDSLRMANWTLLVPVLPIMLIIFALRAARWQSLFADDMRPRFSGSFLALMAGYLFNNLLPARAGELVRVHVIGRREKLPRSAALGTVVVERTLELLVLLALLALVLFTQPLPGWAAHAGKVVAAIACGAFAALVMLGVLGGRLLDQVIPRLRFLPGSMTARLAVSGQAFVGVVAAVLHASHVARFLMLTAIIWALEIAVVWLVSGAFDLPLSLLNILFVMLAIALGTMVPASPGYIGTFEFFGLNALALVGVSGSGALGFVVVLHATLLLGSSLVGAVCLGFMGWPRVADVIDDKEIEKGIHPIA
jgi:uncharacterized protein (TIRG00374 family)